MATTVSTVASRTSRKCRKAAAAAAAVARSEDVCRAKAADREVVSGETDWRTKKETLGKGERRRF